MRKEISCQAFLGEVGVLSRSGWLCMSRVTRQAWRAAGDQWGEAWALKSSGMPRRGAASGTIPGTVHGKVPPFYPPIHQHLALRYLKVFYEHLLVFPLLGWATFPCCIEHRDQEASHQSKWFLWFFFLLPPWWAVYLTQVALCGVMETQPCFVIGTALAGLGTVCVRGGRRPGNSAGGPSRWWLSRQR